MTSELPIINPFRRTTGRNLVLMRKDALQDSMRTLEDAAGLRVVRTAEFENRELDANVLAEAEAIVFDELAVAVVKAEPEQLHELSATAEETGIVAIEPERVVHAIEESPPSLHTTAPDLQENTITSELPPINPFRRTTGARRAPGARAADETELTWGLQVTNVSASQFTGQGIRVAVLDTGLDLQHPDFIGRDIVSQSFVPSQDVQDMHGHGTHCGGTACGPREPDQLPRYGIAYDAEIYVGKVLSNQGTGVDATILAGIEWAITNDCRIISMSLGANVCGQPNQSFSPVYEAVARRALAAGILIIAAAGNDSMRPGTICPVRHPANCPSIMAVAAVDQQLQVASFSCGGLWRQGGQVDIAGPGVAVRSAWPRPALYRTANGTSMATPHVTGIAALLAEANPDMRGGALGWLLLQSTRRLELSARDVGVGLVQAP